MLDNFVDSVVALEPVESSDDFAEQDRPRWTPLVNHSGMKLNRLFRSQYAFQALEAETPDLSDPTGENLQVLGHFLKTPLTA